MNNKFLLSYSPKPRSHVRILILEMAYFSWKENVVCETHDSADHWIEQWPITSITVDLMYHF